MNHVKGLIFMGWIEQPLFLVSFTRATSLVNTLAITENGFSIKRKCRIRNIQLIPLTAGQYYYSLNLVNESSQVIGQLGFGIISYVNSTFFEVGTNNVIDEFIISGSEALRIVPMVHNRIGSTARFMLLVNYDLWDEK